MYYVRIIEIAKRGICYGSTVECMVQMLIACVNYHVYIYLLCQEKNLLIIIISV